MKYKEITVTIEGDLETASINYTKAVAELIKRKFTSNEIDYLIKKLKEGEKKC